MSGFPVTNGVETFSKPPEGYVVDFAHPQRQLVLEHYLIFGIGGPIALFTLLQRLWTKCWLANGLQLDDGFMVLGWMMSVVTQASVVYSIADGGMCTHAWEQPLARFERYSLIIYIAGPVFMLCTCFSKLALLIFYLRLSPATWFRVAIWLTIVAISLYSTVIVLMMLFHCSPVQRSFNFRGTEGSCIADDPLYMANAIASIVTDFLLLVLPIPILFTLRMKLAHKIGVMTIFFVGSVTAATSIIRLVFLPQLLKSDDPSWDAARANMWTFVEANLLIICGSSPTLRKFLKHFAPKLLGSFSSSSRLPPAAPTDEPSTEMLNAERHQRRRRHEQASSGQTSSEEYSMKQQQQQRGQDRNSLATASTADASLIVPKEPPQLPLLAWV